MTTIIIVSTRNIEMFPAINLKMACLEVGVFNLFFRKIDRKSVNLRATDAIVDSSQKNKLD